jgi:hypothetical protein
VGASCIALALLPLLLAPSGPTAVVAFVLAGAPFTLSWVVAGTTVLEHAPAARRSTAVGTTGGVWAGAMLSSALVSGPTADVVGPTAVLLVVTLAHVAAGPAYLLLCPSDAPHTGGRR